MTLHFKQVIAFGWLCIIKLHNFYFELHALIEKIHIIQKKYFVTCSNGDENLNRSLIRSILIFEIFIKIKGFSNPKNQSQDPTKGFFFLKIKNWTTLVVTMVM